MANLSEDDQTKLKEVSAQVYKDQATWFLNAYWERDVNGSEGIPFSTNDASKEKVWEIFKACVDLDADKGEDGNELDMIKGNRLQEILNKPITRLELNKVLKEIDVDKNNRVSLTELMVYNFKTQKDISYLINAPQAGAALKAELEAAERMVAAAQAAIEETKAREKEAREMFRKQKEAEQELKTALEEIKREEEAFENEKADLTQKSEDQNLGIVKRQKAKNMLLQLLAGDPTPLKTAKILQEAAVRKQERATKVAAEARERAERAREDSEKKYQEAEETLEELKSRKGAGMGTLWWMSRELEEAKKYMSKKQRARADKELAAKTAKMI